jgi:hypothetical protein
MEVVMQLIPLSLLVSQSNTLIKQLEVLDAKYPRPVVAQPLFAISGLQSDLQRAYVIDQILMRLEAVTNGVQAEVADAIGDVLETIELTYRWQLKKCLTSRIDSPVLMSRSKAKVNDD